MEDLSLQYKKIIDSNTLIQKAIATAALNSDGGNLWLIGGVVYKTLNKLLYGTKIQGTMKEFSDVDILSENLKKEINSRGYELTYTSLGEPRLRDGDFQIDLIKLANVDYIKRNNLVPSIENYLISTSTDVQSIAYDLRNERLLGIGVSALLRRKISINNRDMLESYCKLRGITPQNYLEKLSKSLDIVIE